MHSLTNEEIFKIGGGGNANSNYDGNNSRRGSKTPSTNYGGQANGFIGNSSPGMDASCAMSVGTGVLAGTVGGGLTGGPVGAIAGAITGTIGGSGACFDSKGGGNSNNNCGSGSSSSNCGSSGMGGSCSW